MNKFCFPGGKLRALTFSYDDGVEQDRKLVEILSKNGLKGTFNLNSTSLGVGTHVTKEELIPLYIKNGHEVALHGHTHPFFDRIPEMALVEDVRVNRIELEDAIGAPVVGMAYPFGTTSPRVCEILSALGVVYSRTVKSTGSCGFAPDNWLMWNPSSHHAGNINPLGKQFVDINWGTMNILYIWGHSYEFDRPEQSWKIIEDFAAEMGTHLDVCWAATNIEIYRYIEATRAATFSADGTVIANNSAIELWLCDSKKEVVTVAPGETKKL